jgi:hypothetical protein
MGRIQGVVVALLAAVAKGGDICSWDGSNCNVQFDSCPDLESWTTCGLHETESDCHASACAWRALTSPRDSPWDPIDEEKCVPEDQTSICPFAACYGQIMCSYGFSSEVSCDEMDVMQDAPDAIYGSWQRLGCVSDSIDGARRSAANYVAAAIVAAAAGYAAL